MQRQFLWLSLAALAVAIVAGSYVVSFQEIDGRADRPPLMDPASHGVDGVLLAKAVKDGDAGTFLYRLYNRMNLWPPGYRVFQAPFYFFFGYEYIVGRLLLNALYVLAAFVIFWVGVQLRSQLAWFVGMSAAILFLAAPQSQAMANMIMLEIPGIVLFCAGIGFYLRFLRAREANRGESWSLRLALICASALFLTKYNFGILLIVPIAAFEFSRDRILQHRLLALLKTFVREGHWRHPFAIFCYVYLAVLFYIRYLGGFEFEFFGQQVIARKKIGNPSYALIVLVVSFLAVRMRMTPKKLHALFQTLSHPLQMGLIYVGLPLLIWFVNPLNWHAFLSFITNESKTERFFVDNFFFYTRVFGTDFAPSIYFGCALLAVATAGLFFFRTFDTATRFFYVLTLLNFLLVVSHHHQGPRYIMIVTPLLQLASMHALAVLLVKFAKLPRARFAALAGATVLFGWIVAQEKPHDELQARFNEHSLSAEHRPVFQAICHRALLYEKSFVLGLWNLFSQGTLSWECWNKFPEMSFAATPRMPTRSELNRSNPDWQTFLSHPLEPLYVAVDYQGQHPQYEEIAGWSLPFFQVAANDPAISLIETLDFPEVAYKVHFFARRVRTAATR